MAQLRRNRLTRGAGFSILTQINARRFSDVDNVSKFDIQVARRQLVKAYRSMCTIRKFEEFVH
jgi:hypothetical protein